VEDFVLKLQKAISDQMSEIRETSLDVGRLVTVSLWWEHISTPARVYLDSLGRFVIDGFPNNQCITGIAYPHDATPQEVVRIEPRFEGQTCVAYVCYLAKKEGDQHVRH
jgi:hypothetical protein